MRPGLVTGAAALLIGLAVLVVGGGTAGASRASSTAAVTYRFVFSGSGDAVSTWPPAKSGTTVFTTTIRWKLVTLVRIPQYPCKSSADCASSRPPPGFPRRAHVRAEVGARGLS